MKYWRIVRLLGFGAFGCSARALLPGTPPPEYEPPILPAWAEHGDAGPSTSNAPRDAAVQPAPVVSGAELSLDAGVR